MGQAKTYVVKTGQTSMEHKGYHKHEEGGGRLTILALHVNGYVMGKLGILGQAMGIMTGLHPRILVIWIALSLSWKD